MAAPAAAVAPPMTTTRRRPSEPPVVDWEAASRRVGGGERDDAFLAELLSTFYADGVEHVVAVLGALDAHRRGERVVDGKAAASVVQAHAHAVKGSASNMALNTVSQAAADLELPLKDALASGADPIAVLDSFVAPPCAKPLAFVSAFRAFAVFMESDAEELVVPPGGDLSAVLDAETLIAFRAATATAFDASVMPLARALAAPLPAPVAGPGAGPRAGGAGAAGAPAGALATGGAPPHTSSSGESDGGAAPLVAAAPQGSERARAARAGVGRPSGARVAPSQQQQQVAPDAGGDAACACALQ